MLKANKTSFVTWLLILEFGAAVNLNKTLYHGPCPSGDAVETRKNPPCREFFNYERLTGGVLRWLGPWICIQLREVLLIWLSIKAQNFCLKRLVSLAFIQQKQLKKGVSLKHYIIYIMYMYVQALHVLVFLCKGNTFIKGTKYFSFVSQFVFKSFCIFCVTVTCNLTPCQRHPFHARLISNSRLTAADHWQDVRLIQFDIKGSGMRYKLWYTVQFMEILIVGSITSHCLG